MPERIIAIGAEAYCVSPNLPPIELPERLTEDAFRRECLNMISQKCKFTGSSDMQKPIVIPDDLYAAGKLRTVLVSGSKYV